MDSHDIWRLLTSLIITTLLITIPLVTILVVRFWMVMPKHISTTKHSKQVDSSLEFHSKDSSLSVTPTLTTATTTSPSTTTTTTTTTPYKCRTTIVLGSGGHTAEMLQLVSGLDFNIYTPRHYLLGIDDQQSASKVHQLEQKKATLRNQNFLTGTRDYSIHRIPRARHVHQSWWSTPLTAIKSLMVATPLVIKLSTIFYGDEDGELARRKSRSRSLSGGTGGGKIGLLSSPILASFSGTTTPPPLPPSTPDRTSGETTTMPTAEPLPLTTKTIILMNGPGTCFPIALAAYITKIIGFPKNRTATLIFVESFARVQTLSLAGKLLYPLCDRFLVQWQSLQEKYSKAEYIGVLV